MAKILLLNSPQSTGKTELVKHLRSSGIPLVSRECKSMLHTLTMQLFSIEESKYWSIYESRELKNKPMPEFRVRVTEAERSKLESQLKYDICADSIQLKNPRVVDINIDLRVSSCTYSVNLSVREAMIYVSECVVKPRWGNDFFGLSRAKSIKLGEKAVDDSAGFMEELPPTIQLLGQENIMLIRIYRQGYGFDGDSRGYIPDGVIDNTVTVYNNWTEQEFFDVCESLVRNFFYGAK